MDQHNQIRTSVVITMCLCFLLLTHSQPPPPLAVDYSLCKEQSYNCGDLSVVFHPFLGQDRPSQCSAGDTFQLSYYDYTINANFTVEKINISNHTMTVLPTVPLDDLCSPQFWDTFENLNRILFQYSASEYYITIFYDCPNSDFKFGRKFMCDGMYYFKEEPEDLLKKFPALGRCKGPLHVPTVAPLPGDGVEDLKKTLEKGIELNYDVPPHCTRCSQNDGNCEREHVLSFYLCPPHDYCPKTKTKWAWKAKVIVGITSAAIPCVLICMVILYLRYKPSTWKGHFELTSKSNQNIEAFLKNHGALTLKRYKLSDVKKITNNFKVKLGQGGFGAVYKGKLSNGNPVAVKILNASKKNGEDFINEVASISRTSHINVVTLLGFCLEGRKRALMYEFMPNGSLDKFIYTKGLETITPLSWDIIYQIAKGIAQGLEYLHRGCNTRILHFDIKPHNILLDEKFCPKIADFGLAKLCPRNESIISMSDARGTMGYVAPEMWSRHLGGVSHKSDVYSYGMMLLEMVGGRKNINVEASHTSEIYFPNWAYNKLELDNYLRPDRVMTTEENEIAKRLAIVSLWCIQTFPNDRPTMSRVIDMLVGNMNSLEIPPKPLLSTPTTSALESSIA